MKSKSTKRKQAKPQDVSGVWVDKADFDNISRRLSRVELLVLDSQADELAKELDDIPLSKNPSPVIPLGYERCELKLADRDDDCFVCQIWFDDEDWSDVFFDAPTQDNEGKSEIYLRCTLPVAIQEYWKPAPGGTHTEQLANAYPMGGYHFAFFMSVSNSIEALEFVDIDDFDVIPVVPKG